MAWSTPRTWVTDELVTAALMNSHVRDNLNATWHLIARKTSDQSVTSSTTLVNDTALILPVAASEVWQFEFGLVFSAASGTGDLQVAFTFPAAGEIAASVPFADVTAAFSTNVFNGTTTPTAVKTFQGPGSTLKSYLSIRGVFINSTTAGNLTLQWSQEQSSATATIMRANSTLTGMKLA